LNNQNGIRPIPGGSDPEQEVIRKDLHEKDAACIQRFKPIDREIAYLFFKTMQQIFVILMLVMVPIMVIWLLKIKFSRTGIFAAFNCIINEGQRITLSRLIIKKREESE